MSDDEDTQPWCRYISIFKFYKQKMFDVKHSMKKYLTRNEQKEAQEAFKIFDQDGSGSISIREFDQILKTLGQTLQEQELQRIVNQIDQDGNGFIDFHQFLQLVAPKIIANRSERVYLEAFKVIDDSDDGLINKEELQRANYITQAGLSDRELDQILDYVETNYKGKFNFSNVLKMLYRIPHQ